MKFRLFLILFAPLIINAQGINNLWMMGYGCCQPNFSGINLNFESGALQISAEQRNMNFLATSVTLCDSSGNPLFYSNGVYIANQTGDTMMNGSGLSPGYYTDVVGWNGLLIPQAALIIPKPGSTTEYYLFHGTIDDSVRYAYHFYYTEIDMTLDSGRGSVISKNNILLNDTLICGRITGVKHANGRDWWVVIHQGKTDQYIIYLVDPSGIHSYTQNIGSNIESFHGQICFSPDGKKLAWYDSTTDLDILDFDRCTGQFSNLVHVDIDDSAAAAGVAFSKSSQFLYVSSTTYVYQFDMNAADIAASQTTVAVWDSFYSPAPPAATVYYLAQLAPDGKIYLSCANGTLDIHVINYPDSAGLACGFCQHCIHLPAYNGSTMPNVPNYFLGAEVGSTCDSLTNDIPFVVSSKELFNIFPNPARNLLYVTLSKKELIRSIKILNSLGQEHAVNYSCINNGEYLEINVSSVSHGIYFLEILTEKQKAVRRFVKE